MSFPCYAAYCDSGVEWMGRLPSHWLAKAVKRDFLVAGGSTPKSDVAEYWDGEITWVTPSDLSKLESFDIDESGRSITEAGLASCGTRMVPAGSVVLSTRAPIGSLAIAAKPLCTNQGCKSLVPNGGVSSRFLAYVLSVATEELNIRGKGTTFLELSGDELGSFKIPVPPTQDEQADIVGFLDMETRKIEELVANQRRLVRLLQEKRSDLISHAVTKGLDSGVPIKTVATGWLNEAPLHWTVTSVKRAFRSMDYGLPESLSDTGAIAVLRMGNIQDGAIDFSDLKYLSDVGGEYLLAPGDLLYNRTNSIALVGKVGMFPRTGQAAENFSYASYLVRLRANEDNCPEFLAYLLNEERFLGLVRSMAFEAIGQSNLNPTRYGETRVALPPISEQIEIARMLDVETGKIDILVKACHEAIRLLNERRRALIESAVTGKIDVRGLAKSAEATV